MMGYVDFFKALGHHKHLLTRQELQTLRGQAMAGDYDGAKKGLIKLLERKRTEAGRMRHAEETTPPL